MTVIAVSEKEGFRNELGSGGAADFEKPREPDDRREKSDSV